MSPKTKPAVDARVVTPSDSTIINPPFRSLLIAVAGNIRIDTPDGPAGETIAVPAGWFPCEVSRVYSTGTTATGISGYR